MKKTILVIVIILLTLIAICFHEAKKLDAMTKDGIVTINGKDYRWFIDNKGDKHYHRRDYNSSFKDYWYINNLSAKVTRSPSQ